MHSNYYSQQGSCGQDSIHSPSQVPSPRANEKFICIRNAKPGRTSNWFRFPHTGFPARLLSAMENRAVDVKEFLFETIELISS